jgi:hypothetical protein
VSENEKAKVVELFKANEALLAASIGSTNETIDGASLVSHLEQYFRRFLILPAHAYLPVTIWTLATHGAKTFDCFPYLAILSPTKRSGKTRLMEVSELFVSQPWRGTAPSVAALYRMLAEGPTLLLDEVEMFSRKDKSETTQTLLAVLNSGHRKGATIPRCDGPKHEVIHFPVYGPKAFAAIGRLPESLTDRSITVRMQRKTKEEAIERFLMTRARRETRALYNSIAAWAGTHRNAIAKVYSELPDLEFLGDRDADLWLPLFATCKVAAPERIGDLRRAAIALSQGKAESDVDDSLSIKLLRDIRAVWPKGDDRCASQTLIEKLKQCEESPWEEIKLTKTKMAGMLKDFEVESRPLRIKSDERKRGYERKLLEAAFARYLDCNSTSDPQSDPPSSSHIGVSKRDSVTNRINTDENAILKRDKNRFVTVEKSASNPHEQRVVTPVTLQKGGMGMEGVRAICPVHHENTSWWQRSDGNLVCQRCHPKPGNGAG